MSVLNDETDTAGGPALMQDLPPGGMFYKIGVR